MPLSTTNCTSTSLMLAVINGRMPTIVMGNSAILASLHPSANAEADAIDTLKIANTGIGERRPRRLPNALEANEHTHLRIWSNSLNCRFNGHTGQEILSANLARVWALGSTHFETLTGWRWRTAARCGR